MEIGTKVQVKRKGLMSTDWIGVVTKVEGHLRVVKFPGRDKPLKYNVNSLKRVPVEPKKPEVDERFEIKNKINLLTNSEIQEQKSYEDYKD